MAEICTCLILCRLNKKKTLNKNKNKTLNKSKKQSIKGKKIKVDPNSPFAVLQKLL